MCSFYDCHPSTPLNVAEIIAVCMAALAALAAIMAATFGFFWRRQRTRRRRDDLERAIRGENDPSSPIIRNPVFVRPLPPPPRPSQPPPPRPPAAGSSLHGPDRFSDPLRVRSFPQGAEAAVAALRARGIERHRADGKSAELYKQCKCIIKLFPLQIYIYRF